MNSASTERIEKKGFSPTHRGVGIVASLSATVASSAAAFLLLAAVDLVSLHVHPYRPVRPVLFILPALSLSAGAFLGVIVWLAGAALQSIAGKKIFIQASALVSAMTFFPFCFLFARGVFSGAGVSRVISPLISIPAATLLLGAITALAVFAGGWFYSRALKGKLDRISWALAIIGFPGFVILLHWINGHAFVRLYPEIHKVQSWTAWAVGTFFFGILLAPVLRDAGRKIFVKAAGATTVLVAVGGFFMARPAGMDHETRFILVAGTVTGREIVETVTRRPPPNHYQAYTTTPRLDAHAIGRLFARQEMSILLITVDALRADMMGVYSPGSRLTPNLDQWARESTIFRRAYCHSPHSSYSIAAILTGEPVRSLAALKQPLPVTLADLLGEKGYSTSAFCTKGVFYTEGERLRVYKQNMFGFQNFDLNGYDAQELTRRAAAVLRKIKSTARPFFLWVHYFDLHAPYRRHKNFDFGPAPLDRYKSETAYTERYIAELIAKARSIEKNVIVVLTADHGEEFGEHGGFYHGNSLYDEQVRVPLIIDIPGVSPRIVRTPVSLVDVAPTLLDALGADIPHNLQGRSLAPYIANVDLPARPVFGEVSTKNMVVFDGVKFITDTWRKTVELYDLEQDPHERRNLAQSRPEKTAELQNLLNEYTAHLATRNRGLPEPLAAARLGGERAREGLCKLVKNEAAEPKHRLEAVQRLSKMEGGCSFRVLFETMQTGPPFLAQEAAISLGELEHLESEPQLNNLMVEADSPDVKHRAAIAAGRLKMKRAAPFLVEALSSSNPRTRYRASHYLGQVGGEQAVRPLMQAVSVDRNAGHLIAVSLGRIGYRTGGSTAEDILDFLSDWAFRETSDHVLASVMKGIGYLGKRRSAKTLVRFLDRENIREAREALVRTRAWGPEYGFWGTDFPPGNEYSTQYSTDKNFEPIYSDLPEAVVLSGKRKCTKNKAWIAFSFLNRTSCLMSPGFRVKFRYDPEARDIYPEKHFTTFMQNDNASTTPANLLLTLRPVPDHKTESMFLTIRINGRLLTEKKLRTGWQELRWRMEQDVLQPGCNKVDVESQGTSGLEVDHLIAW